MNSISNRKLNIKKHADGIAESRDKWINKNSYYYNNDISYMKFLVGENKRILDLGCGTGKLLSALNPSYGVGVDISSNMISIAQKNYPKHEFIIGDIEDKELIDNNELEINDDYFLKLTSLYLLLTRVKKKSSDSFVKKFSILPKP